MDAKHLIRLYVQSYTCYIFFRNTKLYANRPLWNSKNRQGQNNLGF